MKKRKLWVKISLSVAFVLLMGVIYWFFLAKPTSFPTDEELIKEINTIFPRASAIVIQDTVSVDEKHVLVPFISDDDTYGLSYWVWNKHKWRIANIDTKGSPMIWKIDRGDPSSYHLVWNIHPDDPVTSIDFYLMRDRNYHISYDGGEKQTERYFPTVQLGTDISLKEKSYGAMKLPDEWVSVMNAFIHTQTASQPSMFFNSIFPEQYMRFGWLPTYLDGADPFLERTFNGQGYMTNIDINLDFVMILNEGDLEVPVTSRNLSNDD